MTARNLPAIKRVRQTRYVASDGQSFSSHIEAFKHETFIQLRDFIGFRCSEDVEAEALAAALLSSEDFRIVLLGPKTGVREASQAGPGGPAPTSEGGKS